MEQGNVYLSARLKSYYAPGTKDLIVNCMGTLDYKGRLHLYIKEFFNFIPLGKYIMRYILFQPDAFSTYTNSPRDTKTQSSNGSQF